MGFGGDLSRIEIQQQFLSALMRKLKSNDTLTSPSKMVKLAEAATEALTVDSKLDSIGKLKDLGLELGKLNTKNLTVATVPVRDNPAEKVKVTVVLQEEPAQQVFDMIRNDVSFTEVKKKESEKEKKEKGRRRRPAGGREVRILRDPGPRPQRRRLRRQRSARAGLPPDGGRRHQVGERGQRRRGGRQDHPGVRPRPGRSGPRPRRDPRSVRRGDEARRESVTNAQGLPTMTLTLGKDFKGAGVKSRRRLRQGSRRGPEVHRGQGRVREVT